VCVALQIDTVAQAAQWFVDDEPIGNSIDIGTIQPFWFNGGPFYVGMHTRTTSPFRFDLDMFAYVTEVVGPATIAHCKLFECCICCMVFIKFNLFYFLQVDVRQNY